MDLLKHSSNIKAALFLLGFILVIFLFTYTQGIVNELRKDNGEIVKLMNCFYVSINCIFQAKTRD